MKFAILCATAQVLFQGHLREAEPASALLLRAAPAGAVLTSADLSGEPARIEELIGRQMRRSLPAGAAVTPADVRAPSLVLRNKLVRVQFVKGALSISSEGRALSTGSLGESVRVMSLPSKSTIEGVVVGPGVVQVR
jgi:flagella basal body P-ring formation protein FlgA